jgi:hypothetical protein
MYTAQLIDNKQHTVVKAGLDAAAVLAYPPAQANMVSLVDYLNSPAPRAFDILLVGTNDADLTDACYFAWDVALDKAVYLGPVQGGDDLAIKAAIPVAETLERVAGVYSHVGVGGATLSAGSLSIYVRMIEERR